MATATITSKGQVTIPKAIREALGLSAGTQIVFIEVERGKFAIVPALRPIEQLKGIISKPAGPVSIEDMNAAIRQRGAAAR